MFKKEIFKTIFKYAIPNVISMWIFTLYTMIDGIFITLSTFKSIIAEMNIPKNKFKKVARVKILFPSLYLFSPNFIAIRVELPTPIIIDIEKIKFISGKAKFTPASAVEPTNLLINTPSIIV